MRILIISILSIVFCGFIIVSLRLWSLSQIPKKFDHSWFVQSKPIRIVPYRLEPRSLKSDVIWIDVIESKEKNLWVLRHPIQASQILFSDAELSSQQPVSLESARDELQKRKIILNILSNTEFIAERVVALLKDYRDDQVLVQSDYDAVLISFKEQRPLWLYGSSLSSKIRMRTFQSIWLLPAASFAGDVYIGTEKSRTITLVTPEIVSEIHRRNKMIFLGPLSNETDWKLAQSLEVDGVFIDQEDLLGITSSL